MKFINQGNFMIRYILSILLITFFLSVSGQNAYDYDHALKFGTYLYNTNQFNLAAMEFERAVYYKPQDSISNYMLFKTYSVLNRKEMALSGYKRFSGDTSLHHMPDAYGRLYVRLLIKNELYSETLKFIDHNCCLSNRNTYYVATHLAQKDWEKAWEKADLLDPVSPELSPLLSLVDKSKEARYKKPALGAVMSAVIPGSGKIYAGNWQDAIIGFIMTSISGVVAYRAYDKYGINNGYTWFTGILAVGYYSGNVYGGYQAVKKYNLKKEDEIVHETKRYISDL